MERRAKSHRIPKQLAVIDADRCTGCEACVQVCPVDCIEVRQVGQRVKGTEAWCEVDLARCIGCRLCIRLPRKRKDEPFEMLICPWEAIEMVPTAEVVNVVAEVGTPDGCDTALRERLIQEAESVVCEYQATRNQHP